MAHPIHHAMITARKWGGDWHEYVKYHDWFDVDSKGAFADFRHRALRHHSLGITWLEEEFGVSMTNSVGREVPIRAIGEQHCLDDFRGRIPTVVDWLGAIKPERWMSPNIQRQMAESLGEDVYAKSTDTPPALPDVREDTSGGETPS